MPDRSRKKRRGEDVNQAAKRVVNEATDKDSCMPDEAEPTEVERRQAAKILGRMGGKKGGKARAEKLTPEQRTEIARLAAQARWRKTED